VRRQGYTVQQLYERVTPEEVVQASSGALLVAGENAAAVLHVSRHLFGQWMSIAYMTFAQARRRSVSWDWAMVDAVGWYKIDVDVWALGSFSVIEDIMISMAHASCLEKALCTCKKLHKHQGCDGSDIKCASAALYADRGEAAGRPEE
jgi:hypothetical protein